MANTRLQQLDAVMLQEPRYVESWGYEHNFQTELREAAKECGLTPEIEVVVGEYTNFIFDRHPDLTRLTKPWKDMTAAAAPYEVLDILSRARTDIVKRYIHQRLKKYVRDGNERRLVFSPLPQDLADKEPFVWRITDSRFVQTGKYVAGGHWDGDVDPPALTKQKRHLLYLAHPAGDQYRQLWLLAKDTITLADYEKRKQVAKRLMQAP